MTSSVIWQSPRGFSAVGLNYIDWQEVTEIDKRAPLVRRPFTHGAQTHEAWKKFPYFALGGERTHRP
jgi:hypothetical protein